jgi:glyoxylase-like metal-dependent hydrolase (beta-lactamase superfamily II)
MITLDVVAGVHAVTAAGTNLYVVEDAGRVTMVDAGLPRMWDETSRLLTAIGRSWDDVEGFVLTHGHFDHLGLLARAVAQHHEAPLSLPAGAAATCLPGDASSLDSSLEPHGA